MIPSEIRAHIAGFLSGSAAVAGYRNLAVEPRDIVREMYEVGFDPHELIAEAERRQALLNSPMVKVIDILDNGSWSINHEPRERTTIHGDSYSSLARLKDLLPVRSIPNLTKTGTKHLELEDSKGICHADIVHTAYLTHPKATTSVWYHTRYKSQATTVDQFLTRKPTPSWSDEKIQVLLRRMEELRLEPPRLIARRRLQQRELRLLMAGNHWKVFQILENLGVDWSLSVVKKAPWNIELGTDHGVSGTVAMELCRLGVNVVKVQGIFAHIYDPGLTLAKALKRLAVLLSSSGFDSVPEGYSRYHGDIRHLQV